MAIIEALNEISNKLSSYKQTTQEDFIFSSFDIRNAGFKIAHVDANLFPAGFNNLTTNSLQKASGILGARMPKHFKRVLIIPENLSGNEYYVQSIENLKFIISNAGREVRVGSIDKLLPNSEQLIYKNDELSLKDGFIPDLVILNDDLTKQHSINFSSLKHTVMPNHALGWHNRSKYSHFEKYNEIIQKLAVTYKFDPWLLSCYTSKCEDINFKERSGINCLAESVDKILHRIRVKYNEYGITTEPHIYIKADQGTFGMGIMVVKSVDEVLNMNKKTRHSMQKIKYGMQNSNIVLQEGIPTYRTMQGPAEHIAYMAYDEAIGFIDRMNPEKTKYENLNSRGMIFEGKDKPDHKLECIIARIATYAVAQELQDVEHASTTVAL